MEACAFALLLGSAFTAPFSLPAGRAFLGLSAAVLVVDLIRRRQRPSVPASAWLALAFIVVAVVVTWFGVDPARGVPKLPKLLWFASLPVAAILIHSPQRLTMFLRAFALGAGVLCVKIFVAKARLLLSADAVSGPNGPMARLVNAGSMTDSQRLMVAIVVALGFATLSRGERKRAVLWWGLLVALCVALILDFKRGSWISTCIVVACFVGVRIHWKWLFPLACLVVVAAMLPPVRARLLDISTEFHEEKGGRLTMWRRVAPALIRKHPWGIGYRTLTNEMMRQEYPRIERDRNHLHSNIAQVLVATGWLGFGLYVLWMARAVLDAARFARGSPRASPDEAVQATVLLLMLLALLLNGLVEYNFGDAEIVLIYGFVMGCSAAGAQRTPSVSSSGTRAGQSAVPAP